MTTTPKPPQEIARELFTEILYADKLGEKNRHIALMNLTEAITIERTEADRLRAELTVLKEYPRVPSELIDAHHQIKELRQEVEKLQKEVNRYALEESDAVAKLTKDGYDLCQEVETLKERLAEKSDRLKVLELHELDRREWQEVAQNNCEKLSLAIEALKRIERDHLEADKVFAQASLTLTKLKGVDKNG